MLNNNYSTKLTQFRPNINAYSTSVRKYENKVYHQPNSHVYLSNMIESNKVSATSAVPPVAIAFAFNFEQ